jgi:hypothetical protein
MAFLLESSSQSPLFTIVSVINLACARLNELLELCQTATANHQKSAIAAATTRLRRHVVA